MTRTQNIRVLPYIGTEVDQIFSISFQVRKIRYATRIGLKMVSYELQKFRPIHLQKVVENVPSSVRCAIIHICRWLLLLVSLTGLIAYVWMAMAIAMQRGGCVRLHGYIHDPPSAYVDARLITE